MSISDIITEEKSTSFSFEVLPPLKGNGTDSLFRTIDTLKEFSPKYINITTHRSEYVYHEQPDGSFTRSRLRRRPGTIAVASAIMHKYDIKVVPHVVCSGFTKEDIEYMLLDLQFLGIKDLLLLRGDKAKDESRFQPTPGGYSHTTELIKQVKQFNDGFFIAEQDLKLRGPGDFFGVRQSGEMLFDLADIDYAITQMFFDNKKYFRFVQEARKNGITIPIIPALKPLSKLTQFTVVPKTFHLDLPEELSKEAEKCKTDEEMKQLGIEWSIAQCKELIDYGVPSIHFYTMSAVDSIRQIASAIY